MYERQTDFVSSIYPVVSSIDEKLTFAGCLDKYYSVMDDEGKETGLKRNWQSDKTIEEYKGLYNEVIIPELPVDLPLEDYELSTFEDAIQRIIEGKNYEATTIEKRRRLMRFVYQAALEDGVVEKDILWGTRFNENVDAESPEETYRKVLLRKSLTPMEEQELLRNICSNTNHHKGQAVAVLMMACLGLRNHEVAPLTYGDLVELENYPGRYCVLIYQSLTRGRKVLQASGKTKNAVRRLLVPEPLMRILIDRKKHILRELGKANKRGGSNIKPEQLYLACKNHDYFAMCSADDISFAGRQLLKDISFNEKQLAYIEDALGKQYFNIAGIEEKDSTAYLLRRNVATRLYLSGIDENDIQYYMGHWIRNDYVERKDYSNDDFLVSAFKKIEKHPFYSFLASCIENTKFHAEHLDEIEVNPSTHVTLINNLEDMSLSFIGKQEALQVSIRIKTLEPNQGIKVNITGGSGKTSGSIEFWGQTVVLKKHVLIRKILEKRYDIHHMQLTNTTSRDRLKEKSRTS